MNSVLAVYDIPQSLKVQNPSPVFRRYGVRLNLSCWVFPPGCVPNDAISELRSRGVTIHLVEFAEQAQEKILELARQEIKRHMRKVMEHVEDKCKFLRDALLPVQEGTDIVFEDILYKKWRSVLSRARRELIAAEQCALGFSITQDVGDALESLKNVLSAELGLAIQWRANHKPVLVGTV